MHLPVPDEFGSSLSNYEEKNRKAFSIVEPKRVYVDPDCGLKLLPSKIAFEKLRNMCQAARELRNELRKIT